jgi:hypothetical protein
MFIEEVIGIAGVLANIMFDRRSLNWPRKTV